MSESYRWSGGEEFWLRLGAALPRQLLIAPPLFEEANRMRRMVVETMRGLEQRGIGSILPDLPGTGESSIPTQKIDINDWENAFNSAIEHSAAVAIIAFRGGAMLGRTCGQIPRWQLAPEPGERIVRDLKRTRLGDMGASSEALYAGHALSDGQLDAIAILPAAGAQTLRTLRLESDRAPADRHLPGAPLWRRAEPGEDPALSRMLADDIADWLDRCASC